MAGPTDTATTNFDKTVQILIRKELEDELLPSLPHLNSFLGHIKATFIKGSNSSMRFLRVPFATPTTNNGSVSAGTAPWLTEGTAPTALELSIGYEEFTAYQAGQRWTLTDVAVMESPIDLMAKAAEVSARDAAETADEYVGRILAAGTNVLYAGAGNTVRTDVGATDVLTGTLVRRAAKNLAADSVPKFGSQTYHAAIHPAVVFDFEEDDDVGGWLDASRYAGAEAIRSGALGRYAGVDFFESARCRTFAAGGAGGVDVYSTIFLGPDAFAFGDWGKMTSHVSPMVAAPGNELAQSASIGWKGFLGAMLVDEAGARYIRVESASGL
jgi:N4-gp56 family major capsid protein